MRKKIIPTAFLLVLGFLVGHIVTKVKSGLDYKDREIREAFNASSHLLSGNKLISQLEESEIKNDLLVYNETSIVQAIWPLIILKPDFDQVKNQGGHEDLCLMIINNEVLDSALTSGELEMFIDPLRRYLKDMKDKVIKSNDGMNQFYLPCKKMLQ